MIGRWLSFFTTGIAEMSKVFLVAVSNVRMPRSQRISLVFLVFFFQAEDGIRDIGVTGVQTCALPILRELGHARRIAAPEEEPGQTPEGRRARKEALGGGPSRATRCHPNTEAQVPAQRGRARGERVHCQQVASSYGLDPKKRQVGASERDEFLRVAWRALIAGRIDAERLVFVDEMGSNTSLAPVHAWAPRGERARCSVPRNRGKNTTLLASITSSGMGPCVAVVGSTTAAVFEAYVERVLVPALRPGQVVVMDNLGAHKGAQVRELIKGRGCEVCCSCHPTHRTSTRSRKRSRR